jgi:hypothetical protein
MNISTSHGPSEISQLPATQDRAESGTGRMTLDTTDTSPSAVMARLQWLRRSDPAQFKAVMSSISDALFSEGPRVAPASVVEAGDADRTFVMAKQLRHRTALAFGGVALVGVAILSLLQPNHGAMSRAFLPISARVSGETQPRSAVAIPGKPDADLKPTLPAATVALTAATLPRSAAPPTTTQAATREQQVARRRASTKEWNADERWLAH